MELEIYPANIGKVSNSPFCVKAVCLLNMSGLEWTPRYTPDPRQTPKAKLPVLYDGDQVIPDSDQIRDHIESKYNIDFDKGLSVEQKAVSRAFIRMAEEHIYFAVVCDRWLNEENWAIIRNAYFENIPKFIRGFITSKIRKGALAQVKGQGMARHSEQERFERVRKDIDAIETWLGDKEFLHGANPSAVDACVGPALDGLMSTPEPTLLRDYVRDSVKLMSYVERVREELYS